jgi:polysaccharide deacetylase 2 family uncharacterized protein YibQ
MARRRAAAGRRFLPFAILAVVGGLTIGLLLSRPPAPRGPIVPSVPPANGRIPAPAPAARAVPPPLRPAALSVDDSALAAAIRRGLPGLGEIISERDAAQSDYAGEVLLRWQLRTIELQTRHSPEQILRALQPEIIRAGGQVFSRTSPLTFGVVREGRAVVTHQVRLVRPPTIARVAIIFDDAGGSREDLEAIIALARPVTIAVLPGLRFSREVAERTRAAGLEVFLHLPFEADDPTKAMGPGGVAGTMTDAEIVATVRAGLASVPGAVGVNNHMGSKGTADERVMRAVLREVKARGLLWVDSRTSLQTVGARLAGEMGVPAAERQVFLDNEDAPEAIRVQVARLIEIARRDGQAIAIGHAHRQTAQVLREMLGEFDRLGIELVPVSTLAR